MTISKSGALRFWRILAVSLCIPEVALSAQRPNFAPYFDVTLTVGPNLTDCSQKAFTLAFILSNGNSSCDPMWGTEYALDDSKILGQIKELQAQGYVFIVSMGGATGPYLENSCADVNALAGAYNRILDTVGTTHLDLDLENPVNQTLVNQAFAQVQRDKPDTTVSYTLLVRSADVGLTSVLGVDVLQDARKNGVRVDIVNLLAMDFNRAVSSVSMGELIVTAATSVLKQLEVIWPEKSDVELKSMLGVTPMIGRNYNGGTFQMSDAHTVVDWANVNHIGFLSFWSGNRDAPCPGGATDVLSPDCSGIPQQDCEFTRIFQGFRSYLYEAVIGKGKHSNAVSQKKNVIF